MSNVAAMAGRLHSQHRWAVTGTPIGPGGLDDIQGLLRVLHHDPFADPLKWKWCIAHPYLTGLWWLQQTLSQSNCAQCIAAPGKTVCLASQSCGVQRTMWCLVYNIQWVMSETPPLPASETTYASSLRIVCVSLQAQLHNETASAAVHISAVAARGVCTTWCTCLAAWGLRKKPDMSAACWLAV